MEIYNKFIVERLEYLCKKGSVLISNDYEVDKVLDKIILLTNLFDCGKDEKLQNEILNLIRNLNKNIETNTKPTQIVTLKKMFELTQIFEIKNFFTINSINENIDLVNKKATKSEHRANGRKIHIREDDYATKIRNERARELNKKVDKLYYQKISEIIAQMGREIGNVSDEEKIKWIYNYVFGLAYARIPRDCAYTREDGITGYRPKNAMKKITEDGRVVPMDLRISGKEYTGVFSKYNLVFSDEKDGLCGAKAEFIVDLCDFCLSKRNYCIDISGHHMGCSHSWNALINRNGVYHFDASNNWHGKGTQYLTNQTDLNRKWPTYNATKVSYNPDAFPRIRFVPEVEFLEDEPDKPTFTNRRK